MSEWISVKDRLPKYGKRVLIFHPSYQGRPIREAWFEKTDGKGHHFMTDTYSVKNPTHWRLLPSPPEEAENG